MPRGFLTTTLLLLLALATPDAGVALGSEEVADSCISSEPAAATLDSDQPATEKPAEDALPSLNGGDPFWARSSHWCNNDGSCDVFEDLVCCSDCSSAGPCIHNGVCDFDEGDECPDCNDVCGIGGGGPGFG